MIEKNHIVKLVKEYINRFGYIEWEELVDIQVNEEICTIIFIALQKDNKKSYTYKINFESGKIDGLQLIEE